MSIHKSRLSIEENVGNDKKGCSCCGKSCCQVRKVISNNSEHFNSNLGH